MNKSIQYLTALLVGLIALASFILSYHSLYHIALANQAVSPAWAWLWPLLLDAGLLVFSLAILAARLQGERARYAWALTGLYTLATVILNLFSVPTPLVSPWIAGAVAASKPITLFFSFHLFILLLEQYLKRHRLTYSLSELQRSLEVVRQGLVTKEADLKLLEAKIQAKEAELKELHKETRALHWMRVNEETLDRAKQILAERSDISGAELGRLLGRSDTLGRRLKRMLETEISFNGNGRV